MTITHEATMSSTRTAQACHVSGECLAKAIVLRHDGGYLLAVLPASHHIRLTDLRCQIGDDVDLADEKEISSLFPDCAFGAVPPVGECYGSTSSSTTACRSGPTSIWRAAIT